MKTLTVFALSTLATFATISVASADTVIIRRGGYHRPFHPHPMFHRDHRTVIIHRR